MSKWAIAPTIILSGSHKKPTFTNALKVGFL